MIKLRCGEKQLEIRERCCDQHSAQEQLSYRLLMCVQKMTEVSSENEAFVPLMSKCHPADTAYPDEGPTWL